MPSAIMVSTDAGQTWRSARFPSIVGFLHAVTCSGLTCLAIGMSRPGVHGSYFVVRTVNGGATWGLSTLRPPIIGSVTCVTSRMCLATDMSRQLANGSLVDPRVLVSHDAGRTWGPTATPALPVHDSPSVTCGSPTSCVVTAIAPATGAVDALWSTTTGGRMWVHGEIPWHGAGGPFALTCVSGSVCAAVGGVSSAPRAGNGVAASTLSSGARWSSISTPSVVSRTLGCADSSTCFLAGNVTATWGGAVLEELTVSPPHLTTLSFPASSGVVSPDAISCTTAYCVLVGALYAVSNGQATSLAPYVARWSF